MTTFESLTADWLSLDLAVTRILGAASPLESVGLPLAGALGHVTSHAIEARATLPANDNAAMDGYAVLGSGIMGASPESPRPLRVIGASRAGDGRPPAVGPGEAVRIMTGAAVPAGADTVVRVEDTDAEAGVPDTVRVFRDRDVGRHVRRAARDFRAGDVVVPAGKVVTAGWTAVIAAAGTTEVDVHRSPTVAILTTGNELRAPDGFADVAAGRAVPDSNSPMLAAAVREAGGDPLALGIARDETDSLRGALRRAAGADVLVTVGGASMGEADLLKRVLSEEGWHLDFWRVRMRPGSPFSFGWRPPGRGSGQPVFGLPGNPASAFVTFQLLVRPFLRRLSGDPLPHRPVLRARADERLAGDAHRVHLHRVWLTQDQPPRARLTGPQGSGLVSSLGTADGLAVVPADLESVSVGTEVDVVLLGGGLAGRAKAGYRTGEAGDS